MSTERDAMEKQLYEELGFTWKRQNSALTVTIFEPFKVESLVPIDKTYRAHFLMDDAWNALLAARLKLAGVERERACHASDYVVEGRDENETAAAKGSRVLDGRAGMPVGTVGVRPQGDAEDGCVRLDGRESAAVPSLPTGATIGNDVIAEVLDVLWRDIDDLRDPKLPLVQVAAKASNAIHWAKSRAESASLKLAAADRLAEAAQKYFDSYEAGDGDCEYGKEQHEASLALRSALLEYSRTTV